MCKFSVGDYIVGTKESDTEYDITNSRSICKVVNLDTSYGYIEVKVMQITNTDDTAQSYYVEPQFFEKVSFTSANIDDMKLLERCYNLLKIVRYGDSTALALILQEISPDTFYFEKVNADLLESLRLWLVGEILDLMQERIFQND